MKCASLRLLFLAWSVAAFGLLPALASEVVCDDRACLDLDLLKQNLVSGLKDKVEGYALIVGDLPPAYGGLAQTSADAPPHGVPMTPHSLSNVASLSKVLTTVALLQALEKRRLTIDSKIAPFLYPGLAERPEYRGDHLQGSRDPPLRLSRRARPLRPALSRLRQHPLFQSQGADRSRYRGGEPRYPALLQFELRAHSRASAATRRPQRHRRRARRRQKGEKERAILYRLYERACVPPRARRVARLQADELLRTMRSLMLLPPTPRRATNGATARSSAARATGC